MSDDSGLEIISLNKRPGIYSARWAKKHGSFKKAMEYILKKIHAKKNRRARFICSLSLRINEKKLITSIGTINQELFQKELKEKGFGYDPIFIPDNFKKTFGQMNKSKKMKIDHRSIAFKKIEKKIKISQIFLFETL